MHIDEDFTGSAVLIFAGTQIDLVPADNRLLRIALAPVWQPLALAHALNGFLDDAFGDHRGTHSLRLRQELVHGFIFVIELQHR